MFSKRVHRFLSARVSGMLAPLDGRDIHIDDIYEAEYSDRLTRSIYLHFQILSRWFGAEGDFWDNKNTKEIYEKSFANLIEGGLPCRSNGFRNHNAEHVGARPKDALLPGDHPKYLDDGLEFQQIGKNFCSIFA
jgi:hypothetical protein